MAMPVAFAAAALTASAAGAVGPVPNPVTGVTVRIGNTQAQVSFTPGAAVTDPVTSFQATCTSPASGSATGLGSAATSPILVTTMTNADAYTCSVIAVNADGPSSPVTSPSFTPAPVPDAPSAVTAAVAPASAVVGWTIGASTDTITGFSASCVSSNGGVAGGPATTAVPTATTLTVTGLTNGSTYTCTVFESSADGASFLSAPSNTVIPADVPSVPTAVTATTGHNTSTTLTFTPGAINGSAILHYDASCTSGGGATGTGSSPTGSPIAVGGLTNGAAYTCTVTATNSIGQSAAGTSNSFTPNVSAPDPPTAVVATQPGPPPIVATTWSVAFTAPANDGGSAISGYSVLCISTNGGLAGTPTTGPSSPIVVTGLTAGNTYSCAVTATNGTGTSLAGTSASFVHATVPRAPVSVTATAQNGGASVAFVAGVDGGSAVTNFFAACVSSDGGTNFGIFTGLASPIVVQNLTNGKTYTCTVTAQNAIGQGPASGPSNTFVVSAIPGVPGPPTIGTAVIDSQSATVSFTAGNPGDSAIISFTVTCTSTNGGVAVSATDVASPIFVFGLTNGRTYTCAALESNAIGASLYSGHTAAFLVGAIPGPPRSPSARPGNAAATVSWVAPTSNGGAPITGYVVTPFLGVTPQASRTFNGAATTVSVAGLANGRTYAFEVAAKNGIGLGPVSSPSATVLIGTPTAPRSVVASPGLGSAKVSWAAPTSSNGGAINGYTIIPFANGVAKPAITFRTVARTQVIAHLANGVTYSFKVVALNHFGQGPMSTASAGVRIGVPTAPTAVRAQKGPSDSLLVSFTASNPNGSPISKYTVVCVSTNGGATQTKASAVTLVQFKTPSRKKIYTCTVTATNARGTSPASAPSGAIQTA